MKNSNEMIVDVKPIDDETTLKEVFGFGANVAVDSVVGLIDGVIDTGKDLLQSGLKVCQGDAVGASEILKNRTHRLADGVVITVQDVASLAEASYEAIINDHEFMTQENKKRLTNVCKTGVGVLMASSIIDLSK